jgi:hypothetical protein
MDMTSQKILSKSSYVAGLACQKWIWLKFNAPEKLPPADESTTHRFDQGKEVGLLAQQLFKNGTDANPEYSYDIFANDKRSRQLLKEGKTIFEAGFITEDGKCYARADALVPVDAKKGIWDLHEVKSATEVKEDYIEDVAFQKYCYEHSGERIKIRKCFIVHINNEFVKKGAIKPEKLLKTEEISKEVEEITGEVPGKIKKIFEIVALKKCPEHEPGKYYCDDPYGVHEDDEFYKKHPKMDIFHLRGAGQKALELFNAGVLYIKDIPETCKLNDNQQIQKACHTNWKAYHDAKEIKKFLDELKYPLYFMDFETYQTAIPLHDGTRPYQQIPFQFSVHVLNKPGEKAKHYSFLHNGKGDPRQDFMKELMACIGTKGSVLAFCASFEMGRLEECAKLLSEYKKFVENISKRMIDLIVPFRNFFYYHPNQKGSASLKEVLPALTGQGYDDLEISGGTAASLKYLHAIVGHHLGHTQVPEAERAKILRDLEKYCGRDTEGMIWIINELKKLIGDLNNGVD